MDIQKTMQNLEKNGIKPYFVENKDEVVPLVKTLINNGESVSCCLLYTSPSPRDRG